MARMSLRVVPSLKRAAEEFAEKDGVSLNRYVVLALAEKVGSSGAAGLFAERGRNGDVDWAIALLEGRKG